MNKFIVSTIALCISSCGPDYDRTSSSSNKAAATTDGGCILGSANPDVCCKNLACTENVWVRVCSEECGGCSGHYCSDNNGNDKDHKSCIDVCRNKSVCLKYEMVCTIE